MPVAYPASMAVLLAALVAGLFGTVTRAPTMPVCMVGKPCSEPAAGVTLTFTRAGARATSVVTGPAGEYRVVLAPGAYAVRVAGLRGPQRLAPVTVVVRRGVMARQPFVIDTGIR
jgi:hypothetical protein